MIRSADFYSAALALAAALDRLLEQADVLQGCVMVRGSWMDSGELRGDIIRCEETPWGSIIIGGSGPSYYSDINPLLIIDLGGDDEYYNIASPPSFGPFNAPMLADEFALLSGYLEVQRMRMGERLRFSLELPEPLAQADLPPMLLQPLVENALKHGIEPRVDGGEVKVSAREEDGRLLLEVEDRGLIPAYGVRGAPAGVGAGGTIAASTAGSGVGLANVRERLAAAFAGAQFDAGPNPAGGFTVRLSIPR